MNKKTDLYDFRYFDDNPQKACKIIATDTILKPLKTSLTLYNRLSTLNLLTVWKGKWLLRTWPGMLVKRTE